MTDQGHEWSVADADPDAARATPVPHPSPDPPSPVVATASSPADWYPDPWASGHHRYWDGAAWTTGTFPHGPTNSPPEGSDAPPAGAGSGWSPTPPRPSTVVAPETLPAPSWTPPQTWTPDATAPLYQIDSGPAPAERASKPSWWTSGIGFIALVVGMMIIVGSLGTLGGYLYFRHRATTTTPSPSALTPVPTFPGPTLPSPTLPVPTFPGVPPTAVPTDPAQASLASLVLNQADVPSTIVVQPIPEGTQVLAQTATLDLCNGNFPSETLRRARLQVAAYDGQANDLLSTEAVLYSAPGATEQAFAELKSVAAACPAGPVVSPVGEATVATHLNAAPDSAWAQTATVIRQGYDFTATDELGAPQHFVSVYLRRGRVLMAVYFHQPDSPQVSVAGRTSIEMIVAVFAGRMAQLPASVVG